MSGRLICLDCRTRLDPGEGCDAGGERVVSLEEDAGRQALIEEVWGPARRRRQGFQFREALGGLGPTVVAGGTLSLIGEPVAGLALLGCALVTIFAWWRLQRHERSRPTGGRRLAPPSAVSVLAGTARGTATLVAPLIQAPCLAYGLELRTRGILGDDVLLRDEQTCGFDLHTETGRKASIRPGRIRLFGTPRPVHTGREVVDRYLADLDPGPPGDGEPFGPFPWSEATLRVICDGDPALLHGPVDERPDPAGPKGGYREPPATVLVPRGVPQLSGAQRG